MARRFVKYNPSFLSQKELIDNFVVRHTDLELITRIIRDNVTDSNQHILIIGPRGSGKTTLALRVAAEIEIIEDLQTNWYPLIFSEESYEVVSAAEFWLEALFHLSEQTEDKKWKSTYLELRNEIDDQRLGERALAQLLDFADSQGKRILLIVENLNMLFGDLISKDEAWKMRHTLINEPRFMLLASATSRFESIENASQAMFEMFKIHELKRLEDIECNNLWESITGRKLIGERIRPITILTGGNPRLITIIAKFSSHRSFGKLLEDLIDLIDDHTEYFKSHLDSLPPIERKVYLALAELWNPSTARDIAKAARLDVNKTSSLLNRLIGRGAVLVESRKKKTKWYMVAERMYNIYYLMRRRGRPAGRVRAAVKFMTAMYDPESATKLITDEACRISPELCHNHYIAYEETLKEVQGSLILEKIIAATPKSFLESPYINETIRDYLGADGKIETEESLGIEEEIKVNKAREIIEEAKTLFLDGNYDQAHEKLNMVIDTFRNSDEDVINSVVASAMVNKGVTLGVLNRSEEAIAVYEEVFELYKDRSEPAIAEKVASAMVNKGVTLGVLNRSEEAIAVYEELFELYKDRSEPAIAEQVARSMFNKGVRLGVLNRSEEEIAVYKEVFELYKDCSESGIAEWVARAMVNKGVRLGVLNRSEEEIAVYEEMFELYKDRSEPAIAEKVASAMVNKGVTLGVLNRSEEAIAVYEELFELYKDRSEPAIAEQVARSMVNKGATLGVLNRSEEAIAVYEEVSELYKDRFEPAIAEQVARAMVNKGVRLGVLNRSEEEIAVYEEMFELYKDRSEPAIAEQVAMAMVNKGVTLGNFIRYEEAEKAFRQAIELKPSLTKAHIKLFELQLNTPERQDDALRMIEGVIKEKKEDPSLLNSAAWALYKYGALPLLQKAEIWARQAVSKSPDDVYTQHTLACILAVRDKGDQALKPAKKYIQDADVVEKTIEDAIELFVELAAAGCTQDALDLLVNSPAEKHLEPLIIGLRLYLGEDLKVAVEILEVAKDVVKRIEHRRLQRQGRAELKETG